MSRAPGQINAGRDKRGRKVACESRAVEIRARLTAWKQTPEHQRVSLRALAIELDTSHQLLGAYLGGLNKWHGKDYERRAKAIRERAWAEKRGTTPAEEVQAEALDKVAFHYKIEAMLDTTLKRYEKELREMQACSLRGNKLKLVRMLAQHGSPLAQKLLRKHENNLPGKKTGTAKSFRRERRNLATPLKGGARADS